MTKQNVKIPMDEFVQILNAYKYYRKLETNKTSYTDFTDALFERLNQESDIQYPGYALDLMEVEDRLEKDKEARDKAVLAEAKIDVGV